jgi:S-(hydroxymethyl)glutathione dehydrogenase/alcohol dehydrogenase
VFGHYLSGALQLDELVTRTYPLERAAEAMDDMMSGRNAKGVILFD